MNSLKHFIQGSTYYSVSLFVALLLCSSPLRAEIGLTFTSRVTLDLCPEYRFGGVVLEVMYTVGTNEEYHTAKILSQTIDTEKQTAEIDIEFPSTYGTIPFNVLAFCRNAKGFSDRSNLLSVSNCDALANYDTDADGIPNNLEDSNCDNFFSPGDVSNPDNVDTDGDGVRDLVEVVEGTDPTNPGSSPRPFVYSSAMFDPDNDGDTNFLAWRGSVGNWYIRDFQSPGNHLAYQFGAPGDIPFSYSPDKASSDVGVIRDINSQLYWLFHGPGFLRDTQIRETIVPFGIFGDNVVLGPWEKPGVTNPAVARLFNGRWSFYIYLSDGSIHAQDWGGNGDIPKVQDYDGDGLFDIAVFRPGDQKTYVIRSADSQVEIYTFGTGTADHTVRGDYTGDGIDDVSFWEPETGTFTSMTSDNGFDDDAARNQEPNHYFELQLGLYFIHLPINWNYQNGKLLYSVVDHATGMRYYRRDNDPDAIPQALQWGLPGDHQG